MLRSTAKDHFIKLVQSPEVSDAISLIQIAETLNEIMLNQHSLRDMFAAKAMVAFISEGKALQNVPELSYNMADNMLEARKK